MEGVFGVSVCIFEIAFNEGGEGSIGTRHCGPNLISQGINNVRQIATAATRWRRAAEARRNATDMSQASSSISVTLAIISVPVANMLAET